MDDEHDALISRLVPGIDILPKILLGHAVDKGLVRVGIDALDGAADFQVAIRVRRIDDGEGDASIALDVAVFLARGGLAEGDVLAVPTEPDGVRNTITFPALVRVRFDVLRA